MSTIVLTMGHTQLFLAVDGFDYRNQDFSTGAKGYFILLNNEEPTQFSLQNEAIEKY
ncbi:MAG: hypothetical protein H7328_11785 [Bdellovibrio sp.]|nr:hypothetical protein [Bdellovibrio sp.]